MGWQGSREIAGAQDRGGGADLAQRATANRFSMPSTPGVDPTRAVRRSTSCARKRPHSLT